MNHSEIKAFIAKRVAKELKDGDVVNLGIGLPTLVPLYLPKDIHVTLQSENGIVGAESATEETCDPLYVTDAGGQPSAVRCGGAFIDSCTSFGMIRGGHIDTTILGGLEVDEEGSLANWIIPGKKVAGMGGAMDLLVGAKNVIIAMEHTVHGAPKILRKCQLPYTALKCVNKIITEMGVMVITEQGIQLVEINPDYTIEQVQAATEATLIIDETLRPMG